MTHVFVTNIHLHQKLGRDSICIHTPVVSWAIIICHWCWYGYSFWTAVWSGCFITILLMHLWSRVTLYIQYILYRTFGFTVCVSCLLRCPFRIRIFTHIANLRVYVNLNWCRIFSTQCLRYRQMTRLVCMLQCVTLPTSSIHARRCSEILSWVTTWVAAQSVSFGYLFAEISAFIFITPRRKHSLINYFMKPLCISIDAGLASCSGVPLTQPLLSFE